MLLRAYFVFWSVLLVTTSSLRYSTSRHSTEMRKKSKLSNDRDNRRKRRRVATSTPQTETIDPDTVTFSVFSVDDFREQGSSGARSDRHQNNGSQNTGEIVDILDDLVHRACDAAHSAPDSSSNQPLSIYDSPEPAGIHSPENLLSATYGPGIESDQSEEEEDSDSNQSTRRFVGRNSDLATVPRSDAGRMNMRCSDCGALHFYAEIKSQCRLSNETAKFSDCCMKGDVLLPELRRPPGLITRLLENQHVLSTHFKENIRQYNSALAFASMVADRPAQRPGPYSYVIHGQVYHNTGCLANENIEESQYAQLYVLDSDYATELRMRRNQMALNQDLLLELSQTLLNVNLLAQSYQMMSEVVRNNNSDEVFMVFDETKHHGSRRHNAAVENEIAAVFVSDDGEVPQNRAVVVKPKGKDLHRVSILSPFVDSMTYPLLFPTADRGWSTKLRLRNGKTLTLAKYYGYRLGYRPGSIVHSAGKLFQQYIVDGYCKIEENNLNWIRMNQTKLRADSYQGLMDHLANEAEDQNAKVGRRVILPSTFGGSPRSMAQHYQDAMSMVAKLGKPDLCLTFTCNPAWPEIEKELLPGQKPCDRPDLVARVFKLKLDSLREDLFKKNVLGRVIGNVGVVEFQKRGLPHVHMLLTLHPEDKIRSRQQLNDIICAELPDESDPTREKVIRHMIHGPCGDHNQNSPCMVDGECIHNYPKPYASESRVNRSGLPVYRRREGSTADVGRFTVGNEWVVPYNKYLLLRYDAHINIELCGSVKSVKYLFKYIFKGHDAASLRFETDGDILDYDEVQKFVEARYVSSHEACWRILKYPLQFKSHTVCRLAVHEENAQSVLFEEGREDEAVASADERFTTLTGFFALNSSASGTPLNPQEPKDPRNYLYMEIPHKFTFKASVGWRPRERSSHEIGRMYFVSPSHVERFHMRLLLLHVKGPTSFQSLRTVNGVEYPTYKEACQALGLITLDTEVDDTLAEACELYGPEQIRQIFADLLGGCAPNDPQELWDKYNDRMIDDLVRLGLNEQQAISTAFAEIKSLTDKQGLNIETIISKPECPPTLLPDQIEDTIANHSAELSAQLYPTLNSEQKEVADAAIAALAAPEHGKQFFIDGPGGSGKTSLYKALYHKFVSLRKNVVNVAWSGIAAQLLVNGCTAHSTFGLPVPVTKENFMPLMKVNSAQAEVLRYTDVIIWDEAPMAPKYAIEGVDLLLQDIMGNSKLFAGKVVLFGGDFRQIPPIVKEKNNAAIVEATLKRSYIWKHLRHYSLTVNMRARESDSAFRQFLLDVGNGRVKTDENGLMDIPERLRSSGDLITEVYGDDISLLSSHELSRRAVLSLKNSDCDVLNEQVLEKLSELEKVYFSRDQAVSDEDEAQYPIEYINSLTPSGMPKHDLRLKVGAVVMLLRNLNVKKGLCNGTRMIVQRLNENSVECIAVESGTLVVLPRIDTTPCDSNLPFTLKRRQFPIKLCFAMTVNKSQGQSFDKVGVYLPSAPFSHGHLYVALSRCRTAHGLKVLTKDHKVKNVILPELLK